MTNTPDPTKVGPVATAQLRLNQQLSQALPHATREEVRHLQRYLESLPPEAVEPAIAHLRDLPEATVETLKQHLGSVYGQPGGGPAGPAGAEPANEPGARLDERLGAWTEELDRWAQEGEGTLRLLELVTRDHPNSAQMDAINRQLRATLEQLQATGEQLRAIRKQLAMLQPAA